MMNVIAKPALMLAGVLCFATLLSGQDTTDWERRLRELERRMRQIDPTFGQETPGASIAERIAALEKRMDALAGVPLKQQTVERPAVEAFVMPQPSAPATPGYRAAREEEERLPVAGYMDFHLNKPQGEPAQLDFHRFVLLFGHSFSNRIKFW